MAIFKRKSRKGCFALCTLTLGLFALAVWKLHRKSLEISSNLSRAKTSFPHLKRLPGKSNTFMIPEVLGEARLPGKPDTSMTREVPELDELLHSLQTRIEGFSGPKHKWKESRCPPNMTGDASCYDPACPKQFSSSPRKRLKQMLSTRANIPAQYLQAMASAAEKVTQHKYIFVTASSHNHYFEMQGLMRNLIQVLFPRMKGEDYAFVFYNLGLETEEKNLTKMNCHCTFLNFPFRELPDYFKNLHCYTWKPLIVASLLEKAEYLVWMDSGIRWLNSTPLAQLFSRTKTFGYQAMRSSRKSIAVRSQPSTARFFGDQLCQYAPFGEISASFGMYYNDRFMREAVMKPWISCAFTTDCMCGKDLIKYLHCDGRGIRNPHTRYGFCHRFDQSSLGMIFSKLLLGHRPMAYLPDKAIQTKKYDRWNWFATGKM